MVKDVPFPSGYGMKKSHDTLANKILGELPQEMVHLFWTTGEQNG